VRPRVAHRASENEFTQAGPGALRCQGLFCETDKYCRAAAPELASARKRIKARFSVAPEPIELFFPPKWGINDKLPKGTVLGPGQAPANRPSTIRRNVSGSSIR